MLYTGSGSDILSNTGLSYQLADSRLKAIVREWLSLRTVSLKRVSSSNGGLTPGELKHKFSHDTGLYCFNGTMLGCVLELGGSVKQINGRIPYLKTNLKVNKSKAVKNDYEYEEEEEEVDPTKWFSAAKYYTTSFPCHVFKEHFGDGSDTSSKMVDSWQRYTEIGVKISKIGISLVYSDVPDQFLERSPRFIQPWIPEPVNIVPAGIHFG